MHSFIIGFVLGISQIAVIGLQNTFVLKNGILGRPMFLICLVCGLCDAAVITFGVVCGQAMALHAEIMKCFQIAGGCFLFFYGSKLLQNVATNKHIDLSHPEEATHKTILTAIAVSLLNPQAFIDGIMVIGSMSTKYFGNEKIFFTIGCIIASIVWFFVLGYFAKKVSHIFNKPATWKILDTIMAFIMFFLAYKIILN